MKIKTKIKQPTTAPPNVPKADGGPVVANSLVWSHHGQQVRGVCDWSRHDVDDVGLLQHRHHLHGHLNVLHYPVQVRLKQLLPETCSQKHSV